MSERDRDCVFMCVHMCVCVCVCVSPPAEHQSGWQQMPQSPHSPLSCHGQWRTEGFAASSVYGHTCLQGFEQATRKRGKEGEREGGREGGWKKGTVGVKEGGRE